MHKTIPIRSTSQPLIDRLQRIFLIPGRACNFSCRYCYASEKHNPSIKKIIAPETIRFLQEVADKPEYAERTGKDRLSIMYFGGEPLVYFRELQELFKAVNRPSVFRWETVTNGSLLDMDKVDWFNENGFRVCISHDGINTVKTRGRDVFENPKIVECYQALDNPAIETVLTAYSQDIFSYKNYMKCLLGDKFKARFMFLATTKATPMDLVDYDFEGWKHTCARIIERYMAGYDGCDTALVQKHLNLLRKYAQNHRKSWDCNVRSGRIRLTLDGKFLDCSYDESGSLFDADPLGHHNELMEAKSEHSWASNKGICIRCGFYPLCHGHCARVSVNSAFMNQCRFMKVFFSAICEMLQYHPKLLNKDVS